MTRKRQSGISTLPLAGTLFLVGATTAYLAVTSQTWTHPIVVLLVGLAITALMQVVTRAHVRTRVEAEMTSAALRESEEALRESEERARLTLAQALDAVITGDAEGRITSERTRAEQAPRQSEATFRLLFSGNPLSMWVYDVATLRFLEVNAAAVTRYGYSRDEFLRMRITDIRPPEDVRRLEAVVAGRAPGSGDAVPRQSGAWRHRMKDGRIRDVDIVSEAIDFEGCRAALVVAIDVTALKQAQASLAKSTERLEILHEIDRALIAQEEPAAIAQAVLWRLRDLLGVPRAIVNLFDLAAGEAEWLAAVGRRRIHLGPGVRFPMTLMGDVEALRRGRLQTVDVRALPESSETRALLASGVSTYMVAPMIAGGELIGGLSFGGERSEFPPEQVAIAQEAATQLAIAIVQARLHERVKRQAEELEQRVRERTLELSLANVQLQREIVERRRATAEAARANEAKSEILSRIGYELRAPVNTVIGLSNPALLAAGTPAGPLPAEIPVLVFTIDGRRWALPAAGVERVLPMVAISPIPGGPPIALGAINVHGVIVPVVDIRRRLSERVRAPRVSDHLLIARSRRRVFAMPVDEALGVSEIPTDAIVPPLGVTPALNHIAGMVALPDGLLLIQDLDAFFSLDEESALDHALEPSRT